MNDETYQLMIRRMHLSELPESRPNYVSINELNNIKEIHMRQGIISSAKSTHPIIATDGIISCVGVAGYSKELQRGFLAHIDALTDRQPKNEETTHSPKLNPNWALNVESDIMINSLETIALLGVNLNKPSRYEVILLQNGNDKKLFAAVERSIDKINEKYQNVLFLDVVERDIIYRKDSKNIALDLRTGEMHSYSYSINNVLRAYFNKPTDDGRHTRLQLAWPSPIDWTIDDSIKN